MKKSETLVFFGNETLATGLSLTDTPTIKGLIQAGYPVLAIATQYKRGRSRQSRQLEVAKVAKQYNTPLLTSLLPDQLKKELSLLKPSFAILVAHGQIIPADILELFPRGIINIHPSLLPLYRGASPIEQVILDGAAKTGVSLMKLTEEMDAGPIFAQKEISLQGTETKQELADKLLQLGSRLLLDNLETIFSGKLSAKSQDHAKATYTKLLTKEDGLIDWNKPAQRIEREVRAYLGWPKSRAKLMNRDIIITKARVAKDSTDGTLVAQCNPGWLEIQQLTAPSGRIVSGADFLRGYSSKRR